MSDEPEARPDHAIQSLIDRLIEKSAAQARRHRFWRSLKDNLVAGFLSALFLRGAANRWRGTVGQLLAVMLVLILAGQSLRIAEVGLKGGAFYAFGIPAIVLPLFSMLLAVWLVARPQRPDLVVTGTLAALTSGTLAAFMASGLAILAVRLGIDGKSMKVVAWGLMAWPVVATWSSFLRVVPVSSAGHRVVAVLVLLGIGLAPATYFSEQARVWYVEPEQEAEESATATAERDERIAQRKHAMSEAVLYAQSGLLDRALSGLQPQRPGIVDLYLLSFAGDGSQNVFVNEVRSVDKLFADRFDTAGRSVMLGNHPGTVDTMPLATLTSLRRSLEAIASKMNPSEDVLVLFITSHGSREHEISINLGFYSFDRLDPKVLRDALDESGIVNRLVIVSSCYSGGFVDPLASPTSGVITASRSDRTSFGCADNVDWTYFGRAYFEDGLTTTHDFERAFEIASPLVREREAKVTDTQSEPQMRIGAVLHDKLAQVTRRLDALK